ncbi:MAG: hypothetical protein ACP5FH_00465 [Terracidiphilus sp.]
MAAETSGSAGMPGIGEIVDALEIGCNAADQRQLFLILPGNHGPRWLIPARPGAAASVLGAWRPYTPLSRMKWLALRMAEFTGWLRLAPAVSTTTVSSAGVSRWLGRRGLEGPTGEMVVLVGNPSPDRKLIVFLLDEASRPAAVLKIGLTEGGGSSILHEAEVLGRLESCGYAAKVLSVDPDRRIAAQEYVQGAMPGRRFRNEYLDLLCRLPRSGSSRSLTVLAGEMASRLAPFRDELERMLSGVLDRALDCLDCNATVATVLAHKDFAPWNLRRHPRQGYVLVDWEWADFDGLPAYDLLHFHLNDERLFGGGAKVYAALRGGTTCAEYFRRLDLDPKLLPRLAIAYLLDQLETDCDHRDAGNAAFTLRQLAAVLDAREFVP